MKDRTNPANQPRHPSTVMNPSQPSGGALHGRGNEAVKESSRGERSLFDQVLEHDNMLSAWKQAKANKGAPGIDGMSIEEFPSLIRTHWDSIQARLRAGIYQPSPVKRIYIPKPEVKPTRSRYTHRVGPCDPASHRASANASILTNL